MTMLKLYIKKGNCQVAMKLLIGMYILLIKEKQDNIPSFVNKLAKMICENCANTKFYDDELSGDSICIECGLVAKDVMIKPSFDTMENETMHELWNKNVYNFVQQVIDVLQLPTDLVDIVCAQQKTAVNYNTKESCISLIISNAANLYNRHIDINECIDTFVLKKNVMKKKLQRTQDINKERTMLLKKYSKQIGMHKHEFEIISRDVPKLENLVRVSRTIIAALLFLQMNVTYASKQDTIETIVKYKKSSLKSVMLEIKKRLKEPDSK